MELRRTALLTGALVCSAVLALVASQTSATADPNRLAGLSLNQIQVIGTHNSYHFEPSPREMALIRQLAGDARGDDLEYSHSPLDQQFDGQHVRQIELDVFADPEGGRYATPLIRAATGQPPEYDPAMKLPGTKVLHISDVDYRSSCVSLIACLTGVKGWSDRNPHHAPLAVLIEFKDQKELPIPGVVPLEWTRERMLGLEGEIRTVFSRNDLITPDDVRRKGKTLEQSVTRHGWPTLNQARGKVMFLMDNGGVYRDRYVEGNASLEGRVLFTNANPGQPDAAFVKRNDPTAADIKELVRAGYVVRTRADEPTRHARQNDPAMRDVALASGAQWVSTDYPVPGMAARFGTGYVAALPGHRSVRCNPVNAPGRCSLSALVL